MRHVLAGLTLLAVTAACAMPAAAHDRYPYSGYYYAPGPRYVVPAPRYYYPPPAYYYAPAPVYAYPARPYYRPYYGYRPYRPAPRGSATFFFKF